MHSCVVFPLENHFKGKEKIGKPLFEKLIKEIEQNVGKLKIESLSCCIHLVSGSAFGGVWIVKDKIKMDFRLDKELSDPRFLKQAQISKNRYMYYLEIKDEKEIDRQLMNWIKAAYSLAKNPK